MKTKLIALLSFTLCAGVFFAPCAYAAEPPAGSSSAATEETLSVDEVWLTGDTLHIAVTDKTDGESRTFELNLSDYAKPGDEYVTVRAADSAGHTSDAVRFKNPYYAPQADAASGGGASPAQDGGDETSETPGESESAVPGGAIPFTPPGTGSVVDDAAESDGKEFFTVETPGGNIFYLIVDRQRAGENVYLLNAVTENDLASLAESGDGLTSSAVPEPSAAEAEPVPEPSPVTEPDPETSAKPGGMGSGAGIFIILAALAAGGAGYYFKIVRPKRQADDPDDGDEYEDEPEGGEDYGDADARGDERGDEE
jgi:hypothetical protein